MWWKEYYTSKESVILKEDVTVYIRILVQFSLGKSHRKDIVKNVKYVINERKEVGTSVLLMFHLKFF